MNFSQFLAAAYISRINCDEVAGDRPRQLHTEFLALNVDFGGLKFRPSWFKEACRHECQRGVAWGTHIDFTHVD